MCKEINNMRQHADTTFNGIFVAVKEIAEKVYIKLEVS